MKAYCSAKLAKYKELTGGVRCFAAVGGKILKLILRETAEAELEQEKRKIVNYRLDIVMQTSSNKIKKQDMRYGSFGDQKPQSVGRGFIQ